MNLYEANNKSLNTNYLRYMDTSFEPPEFLKERNILAECLWSFPGDEVFKFSILMQLHNTEITVKDISEYWDEIPGGWQKIQCDVLKTSDHEDYLPCQVFEEELQRDDAFLDKKDLQTLLQEDDESEAGPRRSIGAKEMPPPSRKLLLASFTAKHSPNSELTVGARALAKHFHRDKSDSWCTESEAEKNRHALQIMQNVLDNAVWINIHWLPHDVFIIEARQDQGYGLRWSADGSNFRGFLEPQMIDGHEVGWRHWTVLRTQGQSCGTNIEQNSVCWTLKGSTDT
ncbi:uncharacterized protein LOC129926352 [Biomphalaria glabrata]|uniref:Uncharacterized protein LOC129926352 n=1 Tax=Biomphalaria glabrata TaxID=6526 RepID=A0A9W3AEW3_BIOGL|nr:uncharacterized protein LOC129926352 [Biomphalaria glabrata]